MFFAFAFVAGFSVARGWVESHAGLRRIDLEADAAEIKENYDNACAWIAVAIWPVAGAGGCYLAIVGWWAFG